MRVTQTQIDQAELNHPDVGVGIKYQGSCLWDVDRTETCPVDYRIYLELGVVGGFGLGTLNPYHTSFGQWIKAFCRWLPL